MIVEISRQPVGAGSSLEVNSGHQGWYQANALTHRAHLLHPPMSFFTDFFYEQSSNTRDYDEGLWLEPDLLFSCPRFTLLLSFLASEPCMLPSDAGDCHDNQTRWYFDSEKHYCRPFTYSGCHGNSNNFLSKMDCKNACMLIGKSHVPSSLRSLLNY